MCVNAVLNQVVPLGLWYCSCGLYKKHIFCKCEKKCFPNEDNSPSS